MEVVYKRFTDLEKTIAWFSGSQLLGMSFKKKENTWLLTTKVKTVEGGEKVCFIEARDPDDCLYLLERAYRYGDYRLSWYESKF